MTRQRTIFITELDMKRLRHLLQSAKRFLPRDGQHLAELEQELDHAETVTAESIPPDVVTLNSRVRVRDLDSERESVYELVLPSEADVAAKKISIFAPIGTALLGYRAGDTVEWMVPGGLRRLKLLDLVYQPEAAARFAGNEVRCDGAPQGSCNGS